MFDITIQQLYEALQKANELSASDQLSPCIIDNLGILFIDSDMIHPLQKFMGEEKFFLVYNCNEKVETYGNLTLEWEIMIDNRNIPPKKKFLVEPTLQPVDQEEIRYLFSLLATNFKTQGTLSPSIFAYCKYIHPTTKELKTKFMGIKFKTDPTGNITYENLEILDEGCVPIEISKQKLENHQLTTLEAFNTTCYSQYELLNNRKFVGDDETTKFVELTSVFLEATWNMNPTSNFSLPSIIFSTPPNSSNICLTVKTLPGSQDLESFSMTNTILNQLTFLSRISQLQNDIDDHFIQVGNPLQLDEIEKFFNDMKEVKNYDINMTELNQADADETIASFPPRVDHDFTELVWNFCSKSTKVSEIKDVFSVIFDALEHGELLPMIHKTNNTVLANLVREAIKLSKLKDSPTYAQQKETLVQSFEQWYENPLTCLREVGIYKLKRDYTHYLLGEHFSTFDQLKYYLEESKLLSEQIFRFKGLQRVLELIYILKTSASILPFDSMRMIVREALLFFKEKDKVEDITIWVIPLPKYSTVCSTALLRYAQIEPHHWAISCVNSNISYFWKFSKNNSLFNGPNIDFEKILEQNPDFTESSVSNYYTTKATLRTSHWKNQAISNK